LKTLQLLQSHPEVTFELQERFKHFLIDEFQDTDPLQAEIIFRLNSKDGALIPGKLFLVGDPKQSIYRFRKADIDTYRITVNQVVKDGENIVISQNFRSSEPIATWINQFFSEVFGSTYTAMKANPEHLTTLTSAVWLLDGNQVLEKEYAARDLRLLEAQSIASLIQNEVIGKIKVWDLKDKRLRDARLSDIAILFPTTTGVDLFEEQLRKFNLPFIFEGGKMFYHRAEIHGLISVMEAIHRPNDPVSVVSALKSLYFGLSDLDLMEIYQSHESFDFRRIDRARLTPFAREAFQILSNLHEEIPVKLPSEILQNFLEQAWAYPLLLARYHGEQAVSNVDRFFETLLLLEHRGFYTMTKILRWFKTRTELEEEQEESSSADQKENRITLSTIHKSKGLEFPIVILANLNTKGKGNQVAVFSREQKKLELGIGEKTFRFSTDHYEELLESEKEKLADEKKRLLYVAATRTQDLLIISRFAKNDSQHPWSLLDKALEGVRVIPAISLLSQENRKASEPLSTEAFTLRPYEPTGTQFRTGIMIHTPSQDHGEKNLIHSGSTKGAKIGIAVHRAFEFKLQNLKQSNEKIAQYVCKTDHLAEEEEEILKLLNTFSSSDLFKRVLKADRIDTEVPFSYKKGDILVEGTIDLIVEEGSGLTLVDYKTDRIQDSAILERAEKYKTQLKLYTEAIEKMTRKIVHQGLIYFVRLDRVVSIQST